MSRRFLRNYFYGIDEILNTQKLENPDWGKILEVMQAFVSAKGMQEEYREVSTMIPRVLERGFKNEKLGLGTDEKTLDMIWDILTGILEYPEKEDIRKDADILGSSMNCPPGQAFENIVRFGLFCKNENETLFNNRYAEKFRKVLQKVLDHGLNKVKCVLAVFFANLCWLDEEWTKENVNKIFIQDKTKRGWLMWGMYIGWTRPTEKGFAIIREKYQYAVEIEEAIQYSDGENYQKRLMEHLMLAYWQGWIGMEASGMMRVLFGKMDDEMRGEATDWIGSGFEYLKNHDKDEWYRGVEQRVRDYREWRYGDIQGRPKEHRIEARAFAGWVKDSPFGVEETLESTETAVEYAGGVAGRMRDISDYVEGLCALSKGYELRVLKLIQKAIDDPGVEGWSWHYEKVQRPLEVFMDDVADLPDEYDKIDEIRQVAIEIADSLGRLGFEYLKRHYEKLVRKLG